LQVISVFIALQGIAIVGYRRVLSVLALVEQAGSVLE
jgi:hypothetical protein